MKTKHIVFLVPPDSTLLTTVAPLKAFAKAIDQFDLIANKVDFNYQTHVDNACQYLVETEMSLDEIAFCFEPLAHHEKGSNTIGCNCKNSK